MIERYNLDFFVKDPGLLLELCREVFDRFGITTDNAVIVEREAQLGEISNAIERLKSLGVAVPDALLVEKLRLTKNPAGLTGEALDAAESLVDEFCEIADYARPQIRKWHESRIVSNGTLLRDKPKHWTPLDNHPTIQTFVTHPRDARKQTGLNQSDFWTRFGVAQSGGSRYESGRDIAGPTQILMMLYASGRIDDNDLLLARSILGSVYKESSE